MADIFTIESDALPSGTHVVAFRGTEGISKLYRFEIGLLVKGGTEIDLDAATSARATLICQAAEAAAARIGGILAAVELVHARLDQALYRAVLVPAWWTATLTRHSRVFVDKSSTEIIEEVLGESGIDFELKVTADYPKLEHVCQYQESNFAFVARWLEREGMYFYFEQGDAGEKLIITDSLDYHEALVDKPVRYVPLSGDEDVMALEALNVFACRRNMLPAEVALTDYDYRNPSLALRGEAAVDGNGAIVIHGENFRTNGDGERLAKARAEAFLCRRKVFHGSGRVFNLRPGYELTVEEHPQASMNATFLALELVHHGNQSGSSDQVKRLLGIEYDDEYRVDLVAIPEEVQFRPERTTPIPRIDGVLHAVADGPSDSS